MRTIVAFKDGDKIPSEPNSHQKCFRCKGELGLLGSAGIWIASNCKIVISIKVEPTSKEDKIILSWEWFCEACFEQIKKFVKDK